MTKHLLLAVLAASLILGGCLSGEESSTFSESSETPTGSQNSAPRISGSPDSAVLAGDVYEFIPSASDADGNAISFSIANKPTWAIFDSSTGRLYGQPTLADLGSYGSIVITATDGTASVNLQSFSIEVTDVGLGSITLNWTPPTQNEDGSTLTDLAGYRIYYGKSSGSYTNQVNIDTAGISTYVIDNLVPSTYYFVATAVNSAGVESRYSNEAMKEVTSM